jgi:predicted peroxiredoxin
MYAAVLYRILLEAANLLLIPSRKKRSGDEAMKHMKKNIAAMALLAALLFPLSVGAMEPVPTKAPKTEAVPDNTKGLFVVIADADPMTQMMALVLAKETVLQGKSVQILLCGPAGDLALQKSREVMMKPLNKSPQMLMGDLMAKGVPVEVCPLYLPNRGKTEADLIKGVTVAKPPVIAQKLRAEGIRLFTF